MVKFIKAHLENHPDDDPFVKNEVVKCSWKNCGKKLSALVMLVKYVGEKSMSVKLYVGEDKHINVCW